MPETPDLVWLCCFHRQAEVPPGRTPPSPPLLPTCPSPPGSASPWVLLCAPSMSPFCSRNQNVLHADQRVGPNQELVSRPCLPRTGLQGGAARSQTTPPSHGQSRLSGRGPGRAACRLGGAPGPPPLCPCPARPAAGSRAGRGGLRAGSRGTRSRSLVGGGGPPLLLAIPVKRGPSPRAAAIWEGETQAGFVTGP